MKSGGARDGAHVDGKERDRHVVTERAVVPRQEQRPELVPRRPHAHDELVGARRAADDHALLPVADTCQQLERVARVVRVQWYGRVRVQVEVELARRRLDARTQLQQVRGVLGRRRADDDTCNRWNG